MAECHASRGQGGVEKANMMEDQGSGGIETLVHLGHYGMKGHREHTLRLPS